MKILRKGKKRSERKWLGNCRQCDADAVAVEAELKHITDDHRDQCRFSWEVCPVCGLGDKQSGYGGMLFYEQAEGWKP